MLKTISRLIVPQGRAFSANAVTTSVNSDIKVKEEFVNRNPRNLEQMLVAQKPLGFEWDTPSKTYWYRLDIEISSKQIRAKVTHNGGSLVVKAASGEWGIKKQLVSTSDVNAAFNTGRVLARRCLEAGILAVNFEAHEDQKSSKKVQSLLNGFISEGVPIQEPDVVDELEDRPLATLYR